jgi:AcrR family transcriptional regulator
VVGRPAPLTADQREHVRAAVLDLADRRGLDGWNIGDVAVAADVSTRSIEHEFPSKEHLLIGAFVETFRADLDRLADGASGGGRTPRSRVLRLFRSLSEIVSTSHETGRALLQASVSGQPSLAPLVKEFEEQLHMMVARALAGGEPGDPEWAVAEVIEAVWLAAMVSWAGSLLGLENVEESVARALRVLRVNG